MDYALKIDRLCKTYPHFALQNVTIDIPRGSVVGVVGENGAGKSTTMKAVLGLIGFESGTIELLGTSIAEHERALKRRIGVVLEDCAFPPFYRACEIDKLFATAYPTWRSAQFARYLERFRIDPAKKLAEYSTGMRKKLALAAALSHEAELLLLDEPTSGLDPIAREEVLDLLWEFMQNERHAVLLSSHITSDLDKIADSIVFLHEGRVLLSAARDELQDALGLLHCSAETLSMLSPDAVRAIRKHAFGAEVLVRRACVPQDLLVEPVNIEQIMLFLTRGEKL